MELKNCTEIRTSQAKHSGYSQHSLAADLKVDFGHNIEGNGKISTPGKDNIVWNYTCM